jgi:hypothetical protein
MVRTQGALDTSPEGELGRPSIGGIVIQTTLDLPPTSQGLAPTTEKETWPPSHTVPPTEEPELKQRYYMYEVAATRDGRGQNEAGYLLLCILPHHYCELRRRHARIR